MTLTSWAFYTLTLLGGSWVVINGVISRLIWVIAIIMVTLLITPRINYHEPPSMNPYYGT